MPRYRTMHTHRSIMSASGTTHIDQLPVELLDVIFGMLPRAHLRESTLVRRQWTQIAQPRLLERARISVLQENNAAQILRGFKGCIGVFHVVKYLHLRHESMENLEIRELGRLLARLPILRSLRLHTLKLTGEGLYGHAGLKPLRLQKVELFVKYAMEEAAVYALFSLFDSVDEMALDYNILDSKEDVHARNSLRAQRKSMCWINTTAMPIPFEMDEMDVHPYMRPVKVRVRRLIIERAVDCFGGSMARSWRVALLQQVVDRDTLESLDDSVGGCVTGVGEKRSWPNLKTLHLGSLYSKPIEKFYPALSTLYMGDVFVNVNSLADSDVFSPRWPVLAQTLRDSSHSLEEFTFGICLCRPREPEKDRYLLTRDSIVQILSGMDWDMFDIAVNKHPLLHTGQIVVYAMPGMLCDSKSAVEETLNDVVLPSCFSSTRARKIVRFSVQEKVYFRP